VQDRVGRDGAAFPMPEDLATTSSFGFATVPGIYGYDALDAYNTIYTRVANVNNGDINKKNWEVNERIATAYLQANINTDLGSIPVKGNIGIQAVNADQSSTGVSTFAGVTLSERASYGAQYTNYLPSMNLSFELPASQKIRVAAGRQMARPRMDDMSANANYDINRIGLPSNPGVPVWTGSGGNPTLKPWLANAYDLSYEKYFADNRGYVSAAYFYKDLRTYIYNQATQFDFSQLPVPPDALPSDLPPSDIGTYTQPVNGDGGVLKGYELAVSVPFDMLWQPLEGFGAQASYSDTTSNIQPLGPDSPGEPLPGLSKYISNVTVYYERYGFSARVSQRQRSKFLGEVQGFGGDRTKTNFNGEKVIDAQVGYTFQAGPLQDLSILLQVNNINNEPFSSSFDAGDSQPKQYFEYGRTYLLGLNYRF